MNFFKKALGKFFTKSGQTNLTDIAVLDDFSKILRFADDYGSLAKKGYIENCIANTCIRRTIEAIESIPVKYMSGESEIDSSTSNKLLRSIVNAFEDPNADNDKCMFKEAVFTQWFIDGEAYVFLPENVAGNIAGMKYLRPDKVSKTASTDDRVHAYLYTNGDERINFTREYTEYRGEIVENDPDLMGRFNMVIFKNYNPISETDGLSRIKSCALSIDGHNKALKWNNEVMGNSGKMSGVLSFDSENGTSLSKEQIKALRDKLDLQTTGNNRGKILVMNNPAKFQAMSLNSQEMDFINGIVQRAIDICNALDYPPFLLGLNGVTFNNQAEAKLSLYENSAIPKGQRYYDMIAAFLNRKYGLDFSIKLCIDKVDAMAPRFAEKNESYIKQWEKNVLNHNEIREMLGYEKSNDMTGDLYYSDFSNSNNTPDVET